MPSRAEGRRLLVPALLLAPAFLFVIGVTAYPLGLAIWLSFTDAQVGETGHFIGPGNYAYLLRQGTYADALRNTAVYTGLSTLIKAGLGLLMALALARSFPGRRLVYALPFLPLDVIDVALVEGARTWDLLLRVVGPLAAPAMAAMLLFGVAIVFNDFFYAFAFEADQSGQTLVAAVGSTSVDIADPGFMFAAITIGVAPVAVLCAFFADVYARGLGAGLID